MNTRHLRLGLALACLFALATLPLHAGEGEELPFSVARVFFQLNDTDGDLGFHAVIDGDPWKSLVIESPTERELFRLEARSKLRRQGLTELRFESAEPTFDELDPRIFFRRFPEGIYEVEARTLDGGELESEVEITHVLPAAPAGLRVSGAEVPEDCEDDSGPALSGPWILAWDPVTSSHPELGLPGAVEIVRYEVSIEREEPAVLEILAEVPPEVTELEIPEDLLASGDEIKFQILATDLGGNETSSESCFRVR